MRAFFELHVSSWQERLAQGIVGDDQVRMNIASFWCSVHAIIVGHVEWITSYVQDKTVKIMWYLSRCLASFYRAWQNIDLRSSRQKTKDSYCLLKPSRHLLILQTFEETLVENRVYPHLQVSEVQLWLIYKGNSFFFRFKYLSVVKMKIDRSKLRKTQSDVVSQAQFLGTFLFESELKFVHCKKWLARRLLNFWDISWKFL